MERCIFTAYFLYFMKGLNSLHIFLAAAAAAFLLPACGGGDDNNNDYYISPEQFKASGKQFLILTSPRAHFYSQGGTLGGSRAVPMTDNAAGAMFGQTDAGNSQAAAEFKGKNGYIMDGYVEVEDPSSTPQTATIAYYVEGGSTGTGYMYVAPNGNVKNNETSLCHMMGCLSPQDIKYAGLTNEMLPYNYVTDDEGDRTDRELYLVPEMQRVLLVSMEGVAFVIQYNFSQATCKLSLCYAKAYIVKQGSEPTTTNDESQGLSEEGTQMDETMEAAVSITRPFVAQPR